MKKLLVIAILSMGAYAHADTFVTDANGNIIQVVDPVQKRVDLEARRLAKVNERQELLNRANIIHLSARPTEKKADDCTKAIEAIDAEILSLDTVSPPPPPIDPNANVDGN